jgi:hypothetical protein
MPDGFEKVENTDVETRKRRDRLEEKGGSAKPEKIDKANFYSDKKRGDYITDNRKETPNVETDANQ